MTTILPCPFCHHEDVEIDEVGISEYAVDCPECRCIGPICGTVMAAISDWNPALRATANDAQIAFSIDQEAS